MTWEPEDIAGAVEVWVADDIALADGSAVGTWTGRVSGTVLSQSTSGQKPTYRTSGINALPALEFVSANNSLLVCSTAVGTSKPGSYFVVASLANPGFGGACLIFQANNSVPSGDIVAFRAGSSVEVDVESGAFTNILDGDTSLTTDPTFYEFGTTGSTYDVRVNDVAQSFTVFSGADDGKWTGDVTGLSDFAVGGHHQDTTDEGQFDGKIAAVVAVDGAISDDDRTALYLWVQDRYGIDLGVEPPPPPPPPGPYEWELQIVERDGTPVESFHSNEANATRGPLEKFVGQETLNDTAAIATALLPLDAEANDWLIEDRLVLLYIRGQFVTGWTVGAADDQLIAEAESAGEGVTHNMAHLNAILNEGELYPAQGTGVQPPGEDRIFDYSDPSYAAATGWDSAAELETVAAAQSDWPLTPFASDMPDPAHVTVVGSSGTADAGDRYLIRDVVFDGSGRFRFDVVADDGCEVRLDGATIISFESGRGFGTVHSVTEVVTAGPHRVGIRFENAPAVGLGDNPTAVAFRIVGVDSADNETTVQAVSDASSIIWDDTHNTPGWTVGAIGLQVFVEFAGGTSLGGTFAGRGGWKIGTGAVHLIRGYDYDLDANGSTWIEEGESPTGIWDISTKSGTKIGEFFKELGDTYADSAVQWDEESGLIWRLWRHGERGTPKEITIERDENIRTASIKREPTKMTAALVQWHDGFREVAISPAEGHPRKEAFLSLGAQRSAAEVDRVATPQLDMFGRIREKPDITIVTSTETPDDQMPGLAYWVGDTITIPADRDFTPTQVRIIAMTVELGDHGQMVFTPEFGDLILSPAARPAQSMRRMASGGTTGVVSQPAP